MVVATDLDEDKVKKVGGIQLNFPGTSLVLLDWKYNKEDHVVVIIVIVIAMVPPSFYSTGNKVRKTMSFLSLSLLWHLPHPTRLELQQDRPCNLYHCHCHCYDSSLILLDWKYNKVDQVIFVIFIVIVMAPPSLSLSLSLLLYSILNFTSSYTVSVLIIIIVILIVRNDV